MRTDAQIKFLYYPLIQVRFNFLWNCHSYTSQKIFNLDDITNENNKEHNTKWSYIPDCSYRMLIIGGSGSGKTDTLFNLIKEEDSDSLIDKIYLYDKDLNDPKYQFLIKKREYVGIKHFNDSKAFLEYSYNIDDYSPSRKRKNLIVFDDMIADIMSNKKIQAMLKEFFMRCRKLNI